MKDQGDRGREGRSGELQNRAGGLVRGRPWMLFPSYSGIFSAIWGMGSHVWRSSCRLGAPGLNQVCQQRVGGMVKRIQSGPKDKTEVGFNTGMRKERRVQGWVS